MSLGSLVGQQVTVTHIKFAHQICNLMIKLLVKGIFVFSTVAKIVFHPTRVHTHLSTFIMGGFEIRRSVKIELGDSFIFSITY